MKLQNLTIIFIIIILPIVLVLSAYVGYEIKTVNKQNAYNKGLVTATHDAIFAYELNTKNDIYYNNAEKKRSNIKASIKTFENSLSTACNLGLYNNQAIEEYIPAIVFGLYDGFYMYSPTQTQNQGFKHELRNYVYYSEEIKEENIDIVIRYTLDNYVAVSGTINGEYVARAGYLLDLDSCVGYDYTVPQNANAKLGEAILKNNFTYKEAVIKQEEHLITYTYDEEKNEIVLVNAENGEYEVDKSAINYFKESIAFSKWFKYWIGDKVGDEFKYLKIGEKNDPEYENSPFVQQKRKIMKDKIEGVLNSSITAYANKTRNNYKMPKFSEEDWDKIYNNISVISFVQGMNLGFKNYNNYCILNSTNNQEYVNPNLMYFTDGDNYHDIRCQDIKEKETTGYKIGSFEKIKYDITNEQEETTDTNYYYKHNELACYKCVNGSVKNNSSVYEYVRELNENDEKISQEDKSSYFSALARERYKTTKLLSSYNKLDKIELELKFDPNADNVNDMPDPSVRKVYKGELINLSDLKEPQREGFVFAGWNTDKNATVGTPKFDNYSITENTTLYAIWKKVHTITYFDWNGDKYETYNLSLEPHIVIAGINTAKYNFSNWNTKKDGTGTTYTVGYTIDSLSSNLSLYPQGTANKYIVSFNTDGGTKVDSQEVEYGGYAIKPAEPTKRGFTFDGWYTADNKLYDFGQKITGDIELCAKWKDKIILANMEIKGNGLLDQRLTLVFDTKVSNVKVKILNQERSLASDDGYNYKLNFVQGLETFFKTLLNAVLGINTTPIEIKCEYDGLEYVGETTTNLQAIELKKTQ